MHTPRARIIALLAAIMVVAVLAGCGPSEEERKAMQRFNEMPELIERGGYVKKFEQFEQRPDKVFFMEAEIVNDQGAPIGRLRSQRVEGFGTMRPRIQWYETPGVSEEWNVPARGRGRGNRGQNRQREQEQREEQQE